MQRGLVLLFSLLVFGLMIGGTMWHNANSFAQIVRLPRSGDDGGGTTTLNWKLDWIDEKALQAKNNEESAVRALADEIFNIPELALIPTEDRDAMKTRVLSHELAYRSGNSEGIREENIVLTVNELADKFNAPDYARTSALQVRVLRADFLNRYPNFIAQESASGATGTIPAGGGEPSSGSAIGDSVSPTMSPLEAVYMTAMMLEQKMLNENYQHAPQEWVEKVYNKAIEQWETDAARRAASEEDGSGEITYRLMAPTNLDKRNEMMQCFNNGAATLLSSNPQNLMSVQSLLDETLDTLGITQQRSE